MTKYELQVLNITIYLKEHLSC